MTASDAGGEDAGVPEWLFAFASELAQSGERCIEVRSGGGVETFRARTTDLPGTLATRLPCEVRGVTLGARFEVTAGGVTRVLG